MTIIDIKAVLAEAQAEMNKEAAAKFKTALVKQMRIVATAEQVLRSEQLKLEDIKQQIADGTL